MTEPACPRCGSEDYDVLRDSPYVLRRLQIVVACGVRRQLKCLDCGQRWNADGCTSAPPLPSNRIEDGNRHNA